MKCLLLSFLFVLAVMFFAGCNKKAEFIEPLEIIFHENQVNLVNMALGEGTNYYGISMHGYIKEYTADGTIVNEFPGTEYIYGLTYVDGYIYGYDIIDCNIVELNTKTKTLRIIYAGLPDDEIREMVVTDGKIYLVAVPSHDNVLIDALTFADYIDYKERFISIDIKTGLLKEISAVKNPVTLYKNGNGNLFVYAYNGTNWALYAYDHKKDKAELISYMDDVWYVNNFAYENGYFIYISNYHDIRAKNMETGLIYTVADVFPMMFLKCFNFIDGNIVFLEQIPTEYIPLDIVDGHIHSGECVHDDAYVLEEFMIKNEIVSYIRVIRLNGNFARLVARNSGQKNYDASDGFTYPMYEGNVVISATMYNRFFAAEKIKEQSGIDAIFVSQPSLYYQYQEFLTSIMAGNEDIDIYILLLQENVSSAIRDQHGFFPLTDSVPVQDYLNSCFDWVGDAARTKDGEIWMLPLFYSAPVLWGVEKNMERFGIKRDDVVLLDGYIDAMERFNLVRGNYASYTVTLGSMAHYWLVQHELVSGGNVDGKVNFMTEAFARNFEKIYAGWFTNGNPFEYEGQHPVLGRTIVKNTPETYETEFTVFNYMSSSLFMNDVRGGVTNWRALPAPRVSENVKHNYVYCVYAVVNPVGKNKDLAVAYLEAMARDMLGAVTAPVYVIEDLAAYDGYVDMTIPVYRDLYEIFKNGRPISNSFIAQANLLFIIQDYQGGRLDLDEAVNEIQRMADYWYNE
ncbi:MAG: hypothetical protein FWE82_08185 [Defluviitaleaceae bacterium]|nr:hypothetical protein [Defluviitaleaceae bacterium]